MNHPLAHRAGLRTGLAALVLLLGAAGLPAANSLEAALGAAQVPSNEGQFLPPDLAFRLTAFPDGPDRVRLHWQIAEGYYLYRSRIKAQTGSTQAQLGALGLPTGQVKTDDYFGRQEVYHHDLVASLPVARSGATALELPLKVTYQGCADAGLCYPPIVKTLGVKLAAGAGAGTGGATAAASASDSGAATAAAAGTYVSEQDRFATLIRSGNPLVMLGGFFLAGLVLAFTPCVLPMVPILSGIIAGQGKDVTTGRAFALSLTYVLGMAFTYTIAGALFAAAGQQVQAVFQQTWILVLFAGLFVALALSMFGAFTVQMPAAIQTRIASLSNRQSAGTFGGVAAMGALSSLIVTTCVGPALVGALVVIGQTGQIARGSAALFAMSIGMGTPLLLVGASAGRLLPKAGPWMETVKRFFGVLMLAVAAWMLSRVVPARYSLLLWAVPALLCAWVLWPAARRGSIPGWTIRAAGLAAGVFGIVLIVGAGMGGTDPLAPIPGLAAQRHDLPFRSVRSVADLQREVSAASAQGKGVLLDFYADWCVSCKEMERYTFTDAAVQSALHGIVLLRADVTANNADDQALLQHFRIFGPPTIALYGRDGQERRNFRVVGYMKAADFAALLHQALQGPGRTAPPASVSRDRRSPSFEPAT